VTPYVHLTVLKKGARISGTINRDLDVWLLASRSLLENRNRNEWQYEPLSVTMKRKDFA
jgi:hypothetical protein